VNCGTSLCKTKYNGKANGERSIIFNEKAMNRPFEQKFLKNLCHGGKNVGSAGGVGGEKP